MQTDETRARLAAMAAGNSIEAGYGAFTHRNATMIADVRNLLAFAAPPAVERGKPSLYQFGNHLFVSLRAFISLTGIDPSACKVTISFPSEDDRNAVVRRLRDDAPPIGEYSRAISSAQAGNDGGQWQGVAYEFDVIGSPTLHPSDREAIARVVKGARLSAAFGREFRAGDGRLDDVDLDAADAILALSGTLAPEGGEEWRAVDSAPHACHVIAARFDEARSEWIYAVVASPPSKPFTHWQMLPAPPSTEKGEK